MLVYETISTFDHGVITVDSWAGHGFWAYRDGHGALYFDAALDGRLRLQDWDGADDLPAAVWFELSHAGVDLSHVLIDE